MNISQTQKWMRVWSKNIANSYIGSAGIKHKPTSGNDRENQILDVLENLLPKTSSLEKNAVITDSDNKQSNKFDGVLVDDVNWPRLYYAGKMIVVPIESVKVAFEIKSNLSKKDLEKIFLEAKNLMEMKRVNGNEFPLISGFSYNCTNVNLAYYDFVNNFIKNKEQSPALICILNKAIFCLMSNSGVPTFVPKSDLIPTLINAGEDSLLLFVYFLSSFLIEPINAKAIRNYSKELFKDLSSFSFENSFFTKMNIATRKKFMGKNAKRNIEDIYNELNN